MGAFGAHALSHWHPERLATLKTAVQYQLLHAVALLVLSCIVGGQPAKAVRVAVICMASGTLLFSLSLSLIALAGWTMAGAITPIGGTLLIVGWISLAFYRG